VKLAGLGNPVRFDWLTDQGFRLDASPYLSGAYDARKLLEQLPGTRLLHELVRTPNGIFHAGRSSRRWVTDPDYGVPFFSSTDILEVDSSFLPLIAQSAVKDNPRLLIERNWTLITRSGAVGRMAYARADVDGFACSEHVLRVVADPDEIRSGYLYAFLSSRYGIPMITNAAYGAIIQHIEPEHIADLPVPRFGDSIEEEIHGCVQAAADLRARFQAGVAAATLDLFESAGLPELLDLHWHKQSREIGFAVNSISGASLRAVNYSARARHIINQFASVPHRMVGEIARNGQLETGPRFKRIDSDPENGILLVGQRQGFWARPEGRWISPKYTPRDVFVDNETIMIAEHGLVGETALIGRVMLVFGEWTRYAYTQDFLRFRSGMEDFPGAYIFAFLRSEAAFRALRSMLVGTGPQEINIRLLSGLPIPECTPADRERIAATVRLAYRWRDEADVLEDKAQKLLDAAVRDAASADLRQDGDLTHRPREADGTGDG